MRRSIVPILVILLMVEIALAVGIVLAQPGGFGSLASIGFGPERRQELPAVTLPLNGQPALIEVINQAGRLEVSGDATLTDAQLQITKVIHSLDDKDFEKVNYRLEQNNNTIKLEERRSGGPVFFGSHASLIIRLKLPPAMLAGLTARTGSGDVALVGLQNNQATLTITTGSGDIISNDLQVQRLALKTGSGDIRADNFQGALQTETGSGDVRISGNNGLNELRMRTGSGDINFQGRLALSGDGSINTGSGDVRLALADGRSPGFDIGVGSGDIRLNLPNLTYLTNERKAVRTSGSPVIVVRTGSGDVSIS